MVHKLSVKVNELLDKIREQEREIDSLKQHAINYEISKMLDKMRCINGINILSVKTENKDIDDLRKMSDVIRQKVKSGIVVIGSIYQNKILFIATVTNDLIKQGYHAGKIVKSIAQVTGGGGGGRPDFAQAGGKDL